MFSIASNNLYMAYICEHFLLSFDCVSVFNHDIVNKLTALWK